MWPPLEGVARRFVTKVCRVIFDTPVNSVYDKSRLELINNDPELLPRVELVLKWNDTLGERVKTTQAVVEMLCEGVSAFFGPEGTCNVEAIVAQSRNVPMISYVSTNSFLASPVTSRQVKSTQSRRSMFRTVCLSSIVSPESLNLLCGSFVCFRRLTLPDVERPVASAVLGTSGQKGTKAPHN
uniref:Receptor ligand binding region domain-containing protein n=1 Tax=Timema monikensis TaxID=170555 RepID=A0A7R9HNV9_9NEOP|nr:unnamed protein product [Timema monikensis]